MDSNNRKTPSTSEKSSSGARPRGQRGRGRGHQRRGGGPPPPPPGFSSRPRQISECDENGCPLCHSAFDIMAFGSCHHVICYKCSTRLRVLQSKKECPICRQNNSMVIHTKQMGDFEELKNKPFIKELKPMILFENDEVKAAYDRLLEHRCSKCFQEVFKDLRQLELHLRQEHQLFYCDLCIKHNTLFTHERKIYNRSSLATHKRKGDVDDTSHKGHPKCEICENRFYDKDELYRHLRKDHFFCHFCDADGKPFYYGEYSELFVHFKDEHFVCTEGECRKERLTNAFRSEIDLKAHKNSVHIGNFSKAEAKQNRTLDIFIPNSHRNSRDRRSPPEEVTSNEPQNVVQAPPDLSTESFPSLGGASSNNNSAQSGGNKTNIAHRIGIASGQSKGKLYSANYRAPTEEDFPSLSSTSSSALTNNNNNTVNSFSKKIAKPKKVAVEDFPALSQPTKPMPFKAKPPQQYKNMNKKAALPPQPVIPGLDLSSVTVIGKKKNDEDFPNLESSKKNKNKKKQKNTTNNNDSLENNPPKYQQQNNNDYNQPNPVKEFEAVKENYNVNKANLSAAPKEEDFPSLGGPSQKMSAHYLSSNSNNSSNKSISGFNSALTNPKPFVEEVKTKKVNSLLNTEADFPSLGGASQKMSANYGRYQPNSKSTSSGWGTSTKSQSGLFNMDINKSMIKKPSRFTYLQPEQFSDRNKNLLLQLTQVLGGKSLEFSQFKTTSGKFRSGEIEANAFYDQCSQLMDSKSFLNIFRELLVLLPDIPKQQELLGIHKLKNPKNDLKVAECSNCRQVLIKDDILRHMESHSIDNDFPILG